MFKKADNNSVLTELNTLNKGDKMRKEFVAYYRVSTGKQAVEMPAQKRAVKNYLKQFWPPSRSFIEIESGKSTHNRPELIKALNYCKEHKATLVVAKLDRLSRDLAFIATLQDNKEIDFVCCDMPQATKETIAFMGIMARWEREQIAKRTKESLAEKRAQGVLLGANNPKVSKGLDRWRSKQAKIRDKKEQLKRAEREKRKEQRAKDKLLKTTLKGTPSKVSQDDLKVCGNIKILREQNFSYEKIAKALNKSGIKTRRGHLWSSKQVIRVAKRNNIK